MRKSFIVKTRAVLCALTALFCLSCTDPVLTTLDILDAIDRDGRASVFVSVDNSLGTKSYYVAVTDASEKQPDVSAFRKVSISHSEEFTNTNRTCSRVWFTSDLSAGSSYWRHADFKDLSLRTYVVLRKEENALHCELERG